MEPWPLTRTDKPNAGSRKAGVGPRVILKTDKVGGKIFIDGETHLSGVPAEAWLYKLGNRSALEWILEQYKEKTPKDQTIREKFNTYRFAAHKDEVIDLIGRVTRVSIETMGIVRAMEAAER
jgi:predicted helicase